MKRFAAIALLCCLMGCDARESMLPKDASNIVQHGHEWVTWQMTVDGRVYTFLSKDDQLAEHTSFKTLLLHSEAVKAEKP